VKFSYQLIDKLSQLAGIRQVFVAGGPVRDWLLGREILDLDLVLPRDVINTAGNFAAETGGHFVILDADEGVARVVCRNLTIDFSQYRQGSRTIEDDLKKRDFTINAMAISLTSALPYIDASLPGSSTRLTGPDRRDIIDPEGGLNDLDNRLIRTISRENMISDPLRLIRAYRFRAHLDFEIEPHTMAIIRDLAGFLNSAGNTGAPLKPSSSVAAERINHELRLIMESRLAGRTLTEMFHAGLLQAILPETRPMAGMSQPGFHHLDVLDHSLETVCAMEHLLTDPDAKFAEPEALTDWIEKNGSLTPELKWAAFLHDIGKPPCRGEKSGRPTFYHHDHTGAEIAESVGRRLRWPRRSILFTGRLIRLHMRPFHLLHDLRAGGPSRRAMRRLLLEVGDDYPALFLLAMADSMAGCGPLKPPDLDREISDLWARIHAFYLKRLKPVKARPRLITGNDIMKLYGLSPGPLIGKILDAVDEAQVEGILSSRDEAFRWLEHWLENNRPDVPE